MAALEDDERFNAGTGSVLRLDGRSVEMDASVMDSKGTLGSVACIPAVRNPVLVARKVAQTPHILLSGEGARRFAKRCGLAGPYHVTEKARDRHQATIDLLRRRDIRSFPEAWGGFDLEQHWNFGVPYRDAIAASDTVGAVAVDEEGVFAVAGSTGGSSPMLKGRIGDTPILGSGFYAGEAGAVAATGYGEEIMRRLLCREVYQAMADGQEPQPACEAAVNAFPEGLNIGLIAIGTSGYGIASNIPMACWALME